jgi:hypothetical protein
VPGPDELLLDEMGLPTAYDEKTLKMIYPNIVMRSLCTHPVLAVSVVDYPFGRSS